MPSHARNPLEETPYLCVVELAVKTSRLIVACKHGIDYAENALLVLLRKGKVPAVQVVFVKLDDPDKREYLDGKFWMAR